MSKMTLYPSSGDLFDVRNLSFDPVASFPSLPVIVRLWSTTPKITGNAWVNV